MHQNIMITFKQLQRPTTAGQAPTVDPTLMRKNPKVKVPYATSGYIRNTKTDYAHSSHKQA